MNESRGTPLPRPIVQRLALGAIPPAGVLNTTLATPPLPGNVGARTWYLQAVAFPTGDSLNPTLSGDSAGGGAARSELLALSH